MLYALPYFGYKRNFSRGRIKARGGEREGGKLERREKEEVGREEKKGRESSREKEGEERLERGRGGEIKKITIFLSVLLIFLATGISQQ
jgi:hypothetical protein